MIVAVDQIGEAAGVEQHGEHGEIAALVDLHHPLVEPILDRREVALRLRQQLLGLLDGGLGVFELLGGVVVFLGGGAQLFVELIDESLQRLRLALGLVDGRCPRLRETGEGEEKDRRCQDERETPLDSYQSVQPVH